MYLKDLRLNSRKHDLMNEIHEYHELLNAWSNGMRRKNDVHILCRMEKCTSYCPRKIKGRPWNNDTFHMVIEGHFIDGELLRKDKIFLGYNYEHAHSRLNHENSFFYFSVEKIKNNAEQGFDPRTCGQEPITRSLSISHTNPMRQPLRVSFYF